MDSFLASFQTQNGSKLSLKMHHFEAMHLWEWKSCMKEMRITFFKNMN